MLEQIEGVTTPADLPQAVDIAALILGEPVETLSRRTRDAILENTLSYSERDLAAIDWNSALLVEPDGSRDVADIPEFALTHLLEFRYFDELLDSRLQEIMNGVLAAERMSQAQLVEARTRAEVQRIGAEANAETLRVGGVAGAEAMRQEAESAAESQRIRSEAEVSAARGRQELGEIYAKQSSLLRLREIEALAELGRNANARIYIDKSR